MPLDMRQLRYFVSVAQAGALTHAAKRLNIAQSALSHHLSAMEAELGTALVERQARGISLTPAGTRLYEYAQAILSSVKKAEDDIRSFSETPSGTVAIAFAHTAVDIVVLPLILAIRDQHPGIALNICEGLSVSNVNRVLSGESDIAIAFNTPDDARLIRKPLLTEQMCLVGKPELIGENDVPIPFKDVPKQPIIATLPGGSLRAIVDNHSLRSKIKPQERLEIDSLAALRRAMQHGIGCSILSRASVAEQLASGTLSARPIVEPELSRTLEQVSLKDRPRSRAFEEVSEILTRVIQEEGWAGRWVVKRVHGFRRPAAKPRRDDASKKQMD